MAKKTSNISTPVGFKRITSLQQLKGVNEFYVKGPYHEAMNAIDFGRVRNDPKAKAVAWARLTQDCRRWLQAGMIFIKE